MRRGERAIDSRIVYYHCKLCDHITAKCMNRNQMSTQAYHTNPITKTNENGIQRKNFMNLSKAKNNAKAQIKICIVLINEKLTKIITDTVNDVSLMDKKYYNEINLPEFCQKNVCVLTGFHGEETKPIGLIKKHKIQTSKRHKVNR